jgi:hypothetical protein
LRPAAARVLVTPPDDPDASEREPDLAGQRI